MGTRRPDSVPMEVWRGGCETVTQMRAKHWEVISVCQTCDLRMSVRLDWIALLSGPNTSLWNRRAPCRRLLCQGKVRFLAKPPGCFQYHAVDAPWPASRGEPGRSGYEGPR